MLGKGICNSSNHLERSEAVGSELLKKFAKSNRIERSKFREVKEKEREIETVWS